MAAVALAALASVILAACGGSSSTTSTNASANSTTGASGGTGASGPRGAGSARFSALRECLEKNGITLPKRTPGTRPTPGGGGGVFGGGANGAGPQLPKGVTRAQYEVAIKKCGGGLLGRPGRFNSPARSVALTKFASCMRSNGVNLPAPNTSGTGPVFDTKSLNTASSAFKAAEAKCASDLAAGFRRGPTGPSGQASPAS
jgi:hypothetical protein